MDLNEILIVASVLMAHACAYLIGYAQGVRWCTKQLNEEFPEWSE